MKVKFDGRQALRFDALKTGDVFRRDGSDQVYMKVRAGDGYKAVTLTDGYLFAVLPEAPCVPLDAVLTVKGDYHAEAQ